jgi:hypothetical protein
MSPPSATAIHPLFAADLDTLALHRDDYGFWVGTVTALHVDAAGCTDDDAAEHTLSISFDGYLTLDVWDADDKPVTLHSDSRGELLRAATRYEQAWGEREPDDYSREPANLRGWL